MNQSNVNRVAVITFLALGLLESGLADGLSGNETPKTGIDSTDTITLPKPLRIIDLSGRQHVVLDAPETRGVALVFLSTECPMCNESIPRLNKLATQYQKQGVELFGVISDRTVSRQEALEHHTKFRLKFPIILDAGNSLRELTGATHTPEAFVFDRDGKQIYRGLIDDSSERPGKKNTAKRNYLADAMHSTAGGHRLPIACTQAVGCLLEEPGSGESVGEVTFNRDIAPIIFSNCTACHRDGEVAPFALTNYEQVSKRSKQIAEVVSSRLMPPWKPSPDYGHFASERRLSETQISLLKLWSEIGAPEGDRADLPPLPRFPSGWQLGKPDMIVRMPRKFALYADGVDLYKHFVIPLGLS
ncbi:MAG: redoxin domain-containing protein, partial [Schlesneria sp.]